MVTDVRIGLGGRGGVGEWGPVREGACETGRGGSSGDLKLPWSPLLFLLVCGDLFGLCFRLPPFLSFRLSVGKILSSRSVTVEGSSPPGPDSPRVPTPGEWRRRWVGVLVRAGSGEG